MGAGGAVGGRRRASGHAVDRIRSCRENQKCEEAIQKCEEAIAYLRRQFFGSKRERYVDPNQGELFEGQGTVMELVPPEDLETRSRTRSRTKPLFTPESVKDLPTEVIEIDPEGDLSHLNKIGTQEHLVLDYRRARLRVLKYVRNQYVDPHGFHIGCLD